MAVENLFARWDNRQWQATTVTHKNCNHMWIWFAPFFRCHVALLGLFANVVGISFQYFFFTFFILFSGWNVEITDEREREKNTNLKYKHPTEKTKRKVCNNNRPSCSFFSICNSFIKIPLYTIEHSVPLNWNTLFLAIKCYMNDHFFFLFPIYTVHTFLCPLACKQWTRF